MKVERNKDEIGSDFVEATFWTKYEDESALEKAAKERELIATQVGEEKKKAADEIANIKATVIKAKEDATKEKTMTAEELAASKEKAAKEISAGKELTAVEVKKAREEAENVRKKIA